MAVTITGDLADCSTACSGQQQRKIKALHYWPVLRKVFQCYGVIWIVCLCRMAKMGDVVGVGGGVVSSMMLQPVLKDYLRPGFCQTLMIIPWDPIKTSVLAFSQTVANFISGGLVGVAGKLNTCHAFDVCDKMFVWSRWNWWLSSRLQ